MNDANTAYLEKHRDILSFRDLSPHTVDIYSSCLSAFLNWMETELPDIAVADVSWEQLRSYFRMLKDVRHLNSKTVNIHISQLASFFKYVLRGVSDEDCLVEFKRSDGRDEEWFTGVS